MFSLTHAYQRAVSTLDRAQLDLLPHERIEAIRYLIGAIVRCEDERDCEYTVNRHLDSLRKKTT